jgi:hypothetical protein
VRPNYSQLKVDLSPETRHRSTGDKKIVSKNKSLKRDDFERQANCGNSSLFIPIGTPMARQGSPERRNIVLAVGAAG